MKRFEITSPQIPGKASIGIQEVIGWWASKKSADKKYKIRESRLEETVYFVIQAKRLPTYTKLHLQLYDLEESFLLDYLYPDKYKFNGKEETATTYINNGIAFVELKLPPTWLQDIKDDHGKIELYWRVKSSHFDEIHLPNEKDDYLGVRASNRNLYLASSKINENFPEIFTLSGEQVFFLSLIEDEIEGKITDAISDNAKKYMNEIAMVKLEKGYMVNNQGRVYKRLHDGGIREVKDVSYYLIDGTLIQVKQGKNWTTRKKDGTVLSTTGINQYKFFSENGVRVTLLKFISKAIAYMDVFSPIMDIQATDTSKHLSLPLPAVTGPVGLGVSLLIEACGIVVDDKYDQFEADYNRGMMEQLQTAKGKGVQAVKAWITLWNNSRTKKTEYKTLNISNEVASKILNGDFKDFSVLDRTANENLSSDVTILYKKFNDEDKGDVFVIETFLINTL